MRRIYFTGASGVGKTTLARWVSENYGIPLVTGASRLTMEKMGINYPGTFFKHGTYEQISEFQRRAFERQNFIENAESDSYVSDRTILDHLAYVHLLDHLAYVNMNGLVGLVQQICSAYSGCGYGVGVWRLREPDTKIFFVRPCEEFRLAAKDGVRDLFLEPETQCRIDQTIMLMLAVLQIPFIEIVEPSLEYRKFLITQAIGDTLKGESQ